MGTNNGKMTGPFDIFLRHETGVRLEALMHLARPLIDLYGITEDQVYYILKHPYDPEEVEGAYSILTTVRLLWGYFSLPTEDQRPSKTLLFTTCLGADAPAEEYLDFQDLIDTMQEHWDTMPASFKEKAYVPNCPEWSFKQLVKQAVATEQEVILKESLEPPVDVWGPDHLNLPDAIALFAGPLLDEQVEVDQLDEAMSKAHDYWELAQVYGTPLYNRRLDEIKHVYGSTSQEYAWIEVEAWRMVKRFFDLFPEQRSA